MRISGWQLQEQAARGDRRRSLRRRDHRLRPDRTFKDGRKVTPWAGVEPKRSWTLNVTRDRADNNQASSGDKILAGTID